MKLIATRIATIRICTRLTRKASFFESNGTKTGVLNRFYLSIRRLIVLPYINSTSSFHAFPIAVLTFFLFARKRSKDNYGGGNGYFFHTPKVMNVSMLCKSGFKQLIINEW